MRPPLRLPNSIEVLRFAFSDSLSIFSYPQKAKDLPTPSGLCRRYAISIRLQPEGFEGMFWGGTQVWNCSPAGWSIQLIITNIRWKLFLEELNWWLMKLDVWRTALYLEGRYVLLVSLTQTLGAGCLKGGITHVGCQSGSHCLSIPRFQFGTLTLTHSIPCPSSTLLRSLHSLHSLVLFMETAVTSIRLKVIIMSYSCL